MVRTIDMIESAYQSKHMKDLPSWLRRGDMGKLLGQFSSGQARTTSMLIRNLRTEWARAKTAPEKSKAMAKWAGATFGAMFVTNALMTFTRAAWAALVGDDDKRLETIITGKYDKLSGPEEKFVKFVLDNGVNWVISEPFAGIPGVNMAMSALADKVTGRRVWGSGVPSVEKMVDITSSAANLAVVMGGMIEGEEDETDFAMGVVEAIGSILWPARMLERWLKNQE